MRIWTTKHHYQHSRISSKERWSNVDGNLLLTIRIANSAIDPSKRSLSNQLQVFEIAKLVCTSHFLKLRRWCLGFPFSFSTANCTGRRFDQTACQCDHLGAVTLFPSFPALPLLVTFKLLRETAWPAAGGPVHNLSYRYSSTGAPRRTCAGILPRHRGTGRAAWGFRRFNKLRGHLVNTIVTVPWLWWCATASLSFLYAFRSLWKKNDINFWLK